MKTNNWSSLDDRIFDRRSDLDLHPKSLKNTLTKLKQQIAEHLEDLDDRWAKLSTYSEPKIWEKTDRFGKTYYQIFDPKSDRYLHFNSEAEVRCWLDRRFYV